MNKTKEIWMSGFALFAFIFGAGNLILPTFLGVKSGDQWYWVALGFMITGVIIPILAIFAHARIQGTLFDLGKKVTPWFSVIFCILIYLIAILLPVPRTASVVHEVVIQPYVDIDPWVTSSLFFALTFAFVVNRAKIIKAIGEFLTPIIVLLLFVVIIEALFSYPGKMLSNTFESPFTDGMLEGYQTFDAIGGVILGAVLIVSINLRKQKLSYEDKKELLTKSGLIAGGGLLIIYTGLIASGALMSTSLGDVSRTQVLINLSHLTLGGEESVFFNILVVLACFTTAVGVVTGAADYAKGVFKDSRVAFVLTTLISCALGIILGHYGVNQIIDLAIPALMFIYPITIVLILLNIVPEKWSSKVVFRSVTIVTLLFSIPDFLSLFIPESIDGIKSMIPLSHQKLGWVLPAMLTFLGANIFLWNKNKPQTAS